MAVSELFDLKDTSDIDPKMPKGTYPSQANKKAMTGLTVLVAALGLCIVI